jgi:hypothetical protein
MLDTWRRGTPRAPAQYRASGCGRRVGRGAGFGESTCRQCAARRWRACRGSIPRPSLPAVLRVFGKDETVANVKVDGFELLDDEAEMLGRMVRWFAGEDRAPIGPDDERHQTFDVLLELFGGAGSARMLADTRAHGGGTYDAVTLARADFADGYVVAMPWGIVIADTASEEDRAQGVADIAAQARAHGGRAYVGTWQDGDRLHVDVVEHFADRDRAVRWGTARGQISIWDCANACEVPTGGAGSDNVIG